MPKCPSCKQDISSLVLQNFRTLNTNVTLAEIPLAEGHVYKYLKYEGKTNISERFLCPLCNSTVVKSKIEAQKFLEEH